MKSVRVPLLTLAFSLIWMGCRATAAPPAPPQKHIVIVVMDGLRPDSVTAEDMPTLFALAKTGTVFAHHHPVYLSSTEVNGTALATGDDPQHSGIVANVEFRPKLEPTTPLAMEDLSVVRRGDAVMDGHYLAADTMAEILQKAGLRTAIAGTKGVALLQDRKPRPESSTSATVFAGLAMPIATMQELIRVQGEFPAVADVAKEANSAQDAWTARALTETLWKTDLPALSVMWLSDPDYTQHATGPGSPVSKMGLKSCDNRLATVLAALKSHNALDSTDIFIVSDHGFSTIDRAIDTGVEFHKAGFHALRQFVDAPAKGDVLVVGNGGSVGLYVEGHDPDLIKKLVLFLQTSDFAGVIFTNQPLDGTFKLAEAGLNSADAPDVLFSMRWKDEKSAFGLPGLVNSDGLARGPGQGMHATLSKYDMHNTLIAAGPDIKKANVSALPSGNVDVAPTVLAILGVAPPKPMDGRVLSEALIGGADPGKAETKRLESTATIGDAKWVQYLQKSIVAGRVYYDEGNGK